MSAFNTPFQSGKGGLSNPGLPSQTQFRPTADTAIADAVSRAGNSIAQQAIRNEDEKKRQQQMEVEQNQRIALRRTQAEVRESQAELNRKLGTGEINHDQFFEESNLLIDQARGRFDDFATEYPKGAELGEIAFLELGTEISNSTAKIRIDYLEDQAYETAVEDIEDLSNQIQIFTNDSQSGQKIFFIEPHAEKLAMIREQINGDTALSARDKDTLIRSLEESTVYTMMNQLQASGKVSPGAVAEIKRLTDNPVLEATIEKLQSDALDTQQETIDLNAARDYNMLRGNAFANYQKSPAPDVINLFQNLEQTAISLGHDVETDELVKTSLRAAGDRFVREGYTQAVVDGGRLTQEQLNAMTSMETQVKTLIDATGYEATLDGRTLLKNIADARAQHKSNVKESAALAGTTANNALFDPNSPGRAAAVKLAIADGSYIQRAIDTFNTIGSTEPEYINEFKSLAAAGNFTAVSQFANGLTAESRENFKSSNSLGTEDGLVLRLAIKASEGGKYAESIKEVLSDPRALDRAKANVSLMLGRKDDLEIDAEEKAAVEGSGKNAADRPFAEITPILEYGQRFGDGVVGAISFEAIDGTQVPLSLPGYEIIEPFFLEELAIQTALISRDNPGVTSSKIQRLALQAARKNTQERFEFVLTDVKKIDNAGNSVSLKTVIPYDKKLLPEGLTVQGLIGHADYVLRSKAGRELPEGKPGEPIILGFDSIRRLERGGQIKMIVPFVSMVDNQEVGYFTLDSDEIGKYQPESWWGAFNRETTFSPDTKEVQGDSLNVDQYEELLGDGWQEKEIAPGEPLAMGGMSYDPTMLWNPEFYDSTKVSDLADGAQAKLIKHAQTAAAGQFPTASNATKMFVAMNMLRDHGWRI